jgi:hypothetical protein
VVNGVHPDSGFAWQARAISSGVHAQGPPHALHLQVHCPPPTSHQPCVGVGRRPKYSFTDECCGRAGSRDSLWSVSPPPLPLLGQRGLERRWTDRQRGGRRHLADIRPCAYPLSSVGNFGGGGGGGNLKEMCVCVCISVYVVDGGGGAGGGSSPPPPSPSFDLPCRMPLLRVRTGTRSRTGCSARRRRRTPRT